MAAQSSLTTDALSAFSEGDPGAAEHAAKFLKSLAHRDRLKVLCGLLDGELSVADIEAQVGASQSAISQHLARLKEEGIVKSRRDGRKILYSISDMTVRNIIEILYFRFCK
jgi:ArsR family transcriptional regulator